jgi:DNA polymerase/3'-5' exonuclease PolX
MTDRALIPAETAQAAARDLLALLEPACARLEIAGSLRRGVEAVKDVELCAAPLTDAIQSGLFGETQTVSRLEGLVASLLRIGRLSPRLDTNGVQRLGPRYKALLYQEIPVDLFITDAARWGAIYAIRTGPSGFSHLCVTSRALDGAMPYGMRQQDGGLWHGDMQLETPEEEDWFRALGLPCWPPHERTEERLRAYLGERREARR